VEVAVKKVVIDDTDSAETQRTIREIEHQITLVSTLRHPHLLVVYGVCVSSNTELWFVMEYADKGNIREASYFYESGNSGSTRWRWKMEGASGLAYLHSHGLIHGNIKQSNILIVNVTVKLADYQTGIPLPLSDFHKKLDVFYLAQAVSAEFLPKSPSGKVQEYMISLEGICYQIATNMALQDIPPAHEVAQFYENTTIPLGIQQGDIGASDNINKDLVAETDNSTCLYGHRFGIVDAPHCRYCFVQREFGLTCVKCYASMCLRCAPKKIAAFPDIIFQRCLIPQHPHKLEPVSSHTKNGQISCSLCYSTPGRIFYCAPCTFCMCSSCIIKCVQELVKKSEI